MWRKLLGFDDAVPETSAGDTDTVRKIVDRLDRLEPRRAQRIAAFAYILSRVANADLEISSEETRAMERAVVDHADLPEDQAVLVVQIAKSQNQLFGGTENFLVTREFAGFASRDEKVALLKALFAVSAVDESIVAEEDTELRKIASELGLDHREFIAVKSEYREHLEVLKGPDPES